MWNVKSTSRVKLWMFLLIWRPVIRDVSPSEDLFVYTADTCVYFCSPLGAAAPQRHCKSTQPHISHPIRWQEIIAPLWLPGFSDFDCWWCFCRFWTTSVKYFLNDGMMMSLQGRGLSGGLREGWCWVVHVVAFLIPCFYTCLWRACPQFRSPPEGVGPWWGLLSVHQRQWWCSYDCFWANHVFSHAFLSEDGLY